MKKFTAIILSLAILFSFSGCSENLPSEETITNESTAQGELPTGFNSKEEVVKKFIEPLIMSNLLFGYNKVEDFNNINLTDIAFNFNHFLKDKYDLEYYEENFILVSSGEYGETEMHIYADFLENELGLYFDVDFSPLRDDYTYNITDNTYHVYFDINPIINTATFDEDGNVILTEHTEIILNDDEVSINKLDENSYEIYIKANEKYNILLDSKVVIKYNEETQSYQYDSIEKIIDYNNLTQAMVNEIVFAYSMVRDIEFNSQEGKYISDENLYKFLHHLNNLSDLYPDKTPSFNVLDIVYGAYSNEDLENAVNLYETYYNFNNSEEFLEAIKNIEFDDYFLSGEGQAVIKDYTLEDTLLTANVEITYNDGETKTGVIVIEILEDGFRAISNTIN